MELFVEHYEIRQKYLVAKKKYDLFMEKKAMLIVQVEPKAIDTSKEIVGGGHANNPMDVFIEKLEKLDPELQIARNERDLREYQLKKKELELVNSDEILDKIYYLKCIKHWKVRNIALQTNYSRQRIYQLINEINERLDKIRI